MIAWWRASEAGALRVLFAFDPRRQVILLLGGDKSGQWSEWYDWAVPVADDQYDEYLDRASGGGTDMSGRTKWSKLRDELRAKPGAKEAIAGHASSRWRRSACTSRATPRQ